MSGLQLRHNGLRGAIAVTVLFVTSRRTDVIAVPPCPHADVIVGHGIESRLPDSMALNITAGTSITLHC